MNKIFKVVWSKVRNAYVVVSEIAKNTVSGVGKRNRVKRFSMGATLAAVALTSSFFVSNCAWAAELTSATYENYVVLKPGFTKKEAIAKKILHKINEDDLLSLDDIIRVLPYGKCDIDE